MKAPHVLAAVLFPFMLLSCKAEDELKADISSEQTAFEKADAQGWKAGLTDPCTGDWTRLWFLDGEVGTVANSPRGMELHSGPEYKNDAHHMVLWTKESFEGDLKIEYEFTRLDKDGSGVCIIYIQATGSGAEGRDEDITKWNDFRKVPSMNKYFAGMNAYHLSYACGYVRGRRYMPLTGKMNGHTEMTPDYDNIGKMELFEPGVTYKLTIIKRDREIFVKAAGPAKTRYFHMTNEKYPIITHGRIGLRQMYTRYSLYKDFKVNVPKK